MRHYINSLVFRVAATLAVTLVLLISTTQAQTTAFTYQGRLTDTSTPANGLYDFQFKLFDALSAGNQVGSPIQTNGVSVTNGVFNVTLDFGAAAFPGAARFLDISVRLAGGGAFTPLTPRRTLNSVPYAIQSLNATTATNFSGALAGDVTGTQSATTIANSAVTTPKLADSSVTNAKIVDVAGSKVTGALTTATIAGANVTGTVANATTATNFSGALTGDVTGTQSATAIANNAVTTPKLADGSVTNAKIVDVAGSKVTGTIPVAAIPTGSGNYIQNQNTSPQSSANFSISGNGTAGGTLSGGIVNAITQFSLDGSRVLSGTAGSQNLFAGIGAGTANTTGSENSFFGRSAGSANISGSNNSFFGRNAGFANTSGSNNSFFGRGAGEANANGMNNAFFGALAGTANNTGVDNAFFGSEAGKTNVAGVSNSYFGAGAGTNANGGSNNSFYGYNAGANSGSAGQNSFFGSSAGLNTTGSANTMFGFQAGQNTNIAGQSTFVGAQAGQLTTTGSLNVFVGRLAGITNTTGAENTIVGALADLASNNLVNATAIGHRARVDCSNCVVIGSVLGVNGSNNDVAVGMGTTNPQARLHVSSGFIRADSLGSAGSISLCQNASNQISTCSSSLRYKDQVSTFRAGLELINRLRPVTFNWKADHKPDLGLVAEEVAAVEPLLVTHNDKGEIEGVKYAQLNIVLINALKEQQEQLQSLKKANAALEARLAALEKLLQVAAPVKQ